jgi:prolycopene isomerase
MADPLEERYDVVVVGAGMAGLACGALCAHRGLRTLVLDRHTKFGGYNQYFGKELTYDATFHFAGGGGPGGWVYDLLVDVGLSPSHLLIPLAPAYRLAFPEHDLVVPPDAGLYAGVLARQFPAEAANVRRLFADLRAMGEAYRSLTDRRTEGPGMEPLLARYNDATAQQLLSVYVLDPRLQAILTGLWPFHGLPPSRLSALDFAKGWHTTFCQGGTFTWRGGAKELGLALAGAIEARSGRVVARARVQRIVIDAGRADRRGCRCLDGRPIPDMVGAGRQPVCRCSHAGATTRLGAVDFGDAFPSPGRDAARTAGALDGYPYRLRP